MDIEQLTKVLDRLDHIIVELSNLNDNICKLQPPTKPKTKRKTTTNASKDTKK